jgi:hypothetical protein
LKSTEQFNWENPNKGAEKEIKLATKIEEKLF